MAKSIIKKEQYEKLVRLIEEVAEEAAKALVEVDLSNMSDEQRLELFGKYCTYCGCNNPSCQCWNDE